MRRVPVWKFAYIIGNGVRATLLQEEVVFLVPGTRGSSLRRPRCSLIRAHRILSHLVSGADFEVLENITG